MLSFKRELTIRLISVIVLVLSNNTGLVGLLRDSSQVMLASREVARTSREVEPFDLLKSVRLASEVAFPSEASYEAKERVSFETLWYFHMDLGLTEPE